MASSAGSGCRLLNAARTFDAANMTVRGKRLSVDVSGRRSWHSRRRVHKSARQPVRRRVCDRVHARAGARASRTRSGTRRELLTETASGATLSLRRWRTVVGTLPAGLEYNTDTALQTGSLGTDEVSAWAVITLADARAGSLAFRTTANSITPRRQQPRRRHARHIRSALPRRTTSTAWRQVGCGTFAPARRHWSSHRGKACRSSRLHSWWLNEKRNALYGAGGAVLAPVVAGASSAHVGPELDIQRQRRHPAASAGQRLRAHLHGAFLKEATPARPTATRTSCDLRIPRGEGDSAFIGGEIRCVKRREKRSQGRRGRHGAARISGMPAGWVGGASRRTGPKRATCASASLRAPTAPRSSWRTSSDSLRIRDQLGDLEGSLVGRHPRQADARRKPCEMLLGMPIRLDDGARGIAVKDDGDPVAPQSQRPGDHAQQQAQSGRCEDRRRR